MSTEIASLDAPGAPSTLDSEFPVHPLGPGLLGAKYGYSPRLVPWLRREAARFDAVIVDGLWQYGSLATWRALRGTGVPYFVYPHGMLDPWFKRTYPLKHLKKSLYWPWAEYRVLRDARAVLFTTEEERLLARESFDRYRCNELVAGYGTARPQVDGASVREGFLDVRPELRGRRLLLYLSRIHPKKGCDLLIEAYAAVAARDERLHLLMVGPGDEKIVAHLKALAERLGVGARISWPGMLTADDKWGAFHAAELFVLPSHQENFGIAVVEALACGLPVAISNKVNIWREIEANGAGWVADDTLAGTRTLLERWLAQPPGERRRMVERTQACFDAHFDIQQTVANLVMILREAAASAHRTAAAPRAR
jgi:glycosyltransferase involved in cell wall biosynthesis